MLTERRQKHLHSSFFASFPVYVALAIHAIKLVVTGDTFETHENAKRKWPCVWLSTCNHMWSTIWVIFSPLPFIPPSSLSLTRTGRIIPSCPPEVFQSWDVRQDDEPLWLFERSSLTFHSPAQLFILPQPLTYSQWSPIMPKRLAAHINSNTFLRFMTGCWA